MSQWINTASARHFTHWLPLCTAVESRCSDGQDTYNTGSADTNEPKLQSCVCLGGDTGDDPGAPGGAHPALEEGGTGAPRGARLVAVLHLPDLRDLIIATPQTVNKRQGKLDQRVGQLNPILSKCIRLYFQIFLPSL